MNKSDDLRWENVIFWGSAHMQVLMEKIFATPPPPFWSLSCDPKIIHFAYKISITAHTGITHCYMWSELTFFNNRHFLYLFDTLK